SGLGLGTKCAGVVLQTILVAVRRPGRNAVDVLGTSFPTIGRFHVVEYVHEVGALALGGTIAGARPVECKRDCVRYRGKLSPRQLEVGKEVHCRLDPLLERSKHLNIETLLILEGSAYRISPNRY